MVRQKHFGRKVHKWRCCWGNVFYKRVLCFCLWNGYGPPAQEQVTLLAPPFMMRWIFNDYVARHETKCARGSVYMFVFLQALREKWRTPFSSPILRVCSSYKQEPQKPGKQNVKTYIEAWVCSKCLLHVGAAQAHEEILALLLCKAEIRRSDDKCDRNGRQHVNSSTVCPPACVVICHGT